MEIIEGQIERRNPANPADVIGSFPFSSEAADDACAKAYAAFPTWAAVPLEDRLTMLRKLGEAIRAAQEPLAALLSREIGKPLWEAKIEVSSAIQKATLTEESVRTFVSDQTPPGKGSIRLRGRFKPRGALAVLAPFNFPIHLALGHIFPAIATGNTVVLKPSEYAPATSALLVSTLQAAGLPPSVLTIAQGDGRIGQRIARHPNVAGVLFTGSRRVGGLIQADLLEQRQKIVVLEMGGNNASLIWNDADVERASRHVLQSAMITSGQRCTCTRRLYVHEAVYETVRKHLIQMGSNLRVGDPQREDTFMGPVVSPAAQKAALEAARVRGVNLLLNPPGSDLVGKGSFVPPAIHEVDQDAIASLPLADEEIFGPLLTLSPVATFEEAIHRIEQSQYGLSASIYTREKKRFQAFFDRVTAGAINWNRPTTGAPSSLPFGGQKGSGNNFPTAAFAVYYCTYPVSSMMDAKEETYDQHPGFPKDGCS